MTYVDGFPIFYQTATEKYKSILTCRQLGHEKGHVFFGLRNEHLTESVAASWEQW